MVSGKKRAAFDSDETSVLLAALENQPQAVAIYEALDQGRDFRICYMNRAAEKITRRDRGELLGKRLREVFPNASEMGLPELFRRVYRGEGSATLPAKRYSDENVSGWYVNEVTRLPCTRLIVSFRDVSAEVQVQRALEHSEEAHRIMLEELSEGMLLLEEGRVSLANAAALRILGASELDHLAGRPFESLVIEPDEPAVQLALRSLGWELPRVVELRAPRQHGEPRWLRATFRREAKHAAPSARTTVLLEDISSEKLIEQRVAERLADISNHDALPADLTIAEVLDIESIQALLDALYAATGLPSAILDLDDRPLTRSGWHEACTRFHRAHPVSCERCLQSDARVREQLPESGHIAYECGNGLWDFAFPIRLHGRHIATFFFGQVFLEASPPDEERFRRQADECGFEIESYLDAIRRVPRLSRAKIDTIMRFCDTLVEQITALASQGLSHLASTDRLLRAEASLEEQQRLLAEAERLAGLGAWRLEARTLNFTASDEWHRIHGTSSEERTFEELLKLAHPDDLALVSAALDRALEHGSRYEIEHRIIRADNGETRWVRALGEVLKDKEGRILRLIGAAQDITDDRAAAEEKHQIEQAMQHSQRLESLGLLAGGIAHDFNNLLAVILGNAELLSSGTSAERERSEQLQSIIQASETGAGLTRQLLAYAGQAPVSMSALRLGELIEDTRELLATALRKGMRLHLQIPREPIWVSADRSQLRQVLLNLVINASEATNDARGVVTIAAGIEKLTEKDSLDLVGAEDLAEGPVAYLEVKDRGHGMNQETRHRIFEPFFTTKFQGRGLGMSAVLGIARSHGGALRVSERARGGSAVRLYLPLGSPDAAHEKQNEERAAPLAPERAQALIVDDELAVREVAARMLRRLGLAPVTCASGEEGLARAEALGESLRVVMLDYTMPGLSGAETLQQLRTKHPELPVIMASGFKKEQVMSDVDDDRWSIFLPKPFRIGALRACLESLGVLAAPDREDTR